MRFVAVRVLCEFDWVFDRVKITYRGEPVRVKDGMSLRNGMWHELRNGIIMTAECNLCSVTLNYALFENLEEFQRKAYSNVLPEIFDVCLEL